MTVAVMKTKAEQSFAEGFNEMRATLPGSAAVREAREGAARRFEELGLPHRRIEEWKYTDLRSAVKEALPARSGDKLAMTIADVIVAIGPLAQIDAHRIVFVNGAHRPDLSTPGSLAGLEVESLASTLEDAQATEFALSGFAGQDSNAVLALNTAYMSDGAIVRVHAEAELEKPLLLVNIRAGAQPCFAAVRNVLEVGAKASARIVEAFVSLPGAAGDGQINTATQINVGDEARLTHVKIAADDGSGVTHLANWFARLGKACEYRGFQLTQGVNLARNQIQVAFDGEDAKLDLSGVFLGRGTDHVDTTLVVDHAVPSCESRELFKGVLDGHSRGIFQGKIIVQAVAQKTDGKQMSQALLLSPDAEFDSKPELEIFADDVVCGHGATCAELDKDLMFYCQSRGIPTDVARVLLIESFIGEAVALVEDEAINEALMGFARDWLSK
ncbi:MAG: Fe-S cluster assembly protein SufD [Alphaproteobacteria bacterium BRH_c36]|nr:MAG: Fe-S cluster assembly protein SufD [Alphaproteobacteria bacterium BRH_c36]